MITVGYLDRHTSIQQYSSVSGVRVPETIKAAWVPYGRTLRQLRAQAGLTCRQLAAKASCAESLISKVERGRRRVSGQVSSQLGTALQPLVPEAGKRLEQAHESAVHASQYTWYTDIANLEVQAETIQIWEPLLVPGIFQTSSYATTVFSEGRPQAAPEEIKKLVAARMERARSVADKEIWAILDETVLYRPVGGHQVMIDQINHLLGLPCKQTKIRVVPRTSPYCGGLAGSIMVISSNRTSVYVEHTAGGDIITDPASISRISAVWREISAWAISPAASITAMKKAVTYHKEQETHHKEQEKV